MFLPQLTSVYGAVVILIVTDSFDANANYVISELNSSGIPWARLNFDEFPLNVSIGVDPVDFKKSQFIDEFGEKFVLEEVGTLWIWKPGEHRLGANLDQAQSKFVDDACRRTCLTVLRQLHETSFVVNPLQASRHANDKGVQLRLAKKLGFIVPDTIITNSPQMAREFCNKHDEIIFKLINKPMIDYPDKAIWISANLLKQEDIDALDSIRECPGIFQKRIPKKFDLRITIVGNDVFPVEIHSQIDDRTSVDFRRTWEVNVPLPHIPHELPDNMRKKCLHFARSLGLVYCAIDMVVTPRGEYVFLEVNPSGQWGWIEEAANLPITEAFAKMLSRGSI